MTSTIYGIFFLVLYNLFMAFNDVLLAKIVQEQDPAVVLVACFLIVILFFNLLGWRLWKKANLMTIIENRSDILILNVLTAISWFSFSLAFKSLEPVIVLSISMSIGPIITELLEKYYGNPKQYDSIDRTISCGLLIIAFSSIYISGKGSSGIGVLSTIDLIFSSLLSFLAGVVMVFQNIYSKKLSDNRLPPAHIMAVRYIILLLCGLLCSTKDNFTLLFEGDQFLIVCILAVFGCIIPLYAYLVGIKKCQLYTASLVIAGSPLFEFLLELFDSRISLSIPSFIIAFTSTMLIYLGIVKEIRRSGKKTNIILNQQIAI